VNGEAAGRLIQTVDETERDEAPRVNFRAALTSQFGLIIALTFLIMISSQAIETQYPSYMQSVFDIDPSVSATALSVIMLIAIPLYLVAGQWTAKAGPRVPFIVSAAARLVAGVGLFLIPQTAGMVALLLFGLMMISYPFFELNAALLASASSPIGQGAAQGASGAALALGEMIAAILAGWLATQFGFSSLASIVIIAAGAATVLGMLLLRSPGGDSNILTSPQTFGHH
jgi:sugar phosphate permease